MSCKCKYPLRLVSSYSNDRLFIRSLINDPLNQVVSPANGCVIKERSVKELREGVVCKWAAHPRDRLVKGCVELASYCGDRLLKSMIFRWPKCFSYLRNGLIARCSEKTVVTHIKCYCLFEDHRDALFK